MKRQTLSILLSILISATAIGQNYQVQPFSNAPARPNTTINKTFNNSNQVNPSGTNEHVGNKCLQHSVTEELMERNAEYRQGVESARQMTNQIIRDIDSGERSAPPVYTIPVVFHVIHKGEAVGSVTNISTAQLESAIDALNRDFRRTNDDNGIALGNGPDTEIQFCLAGVDPNGNPHSGINRFNGSGVSGYSTNGIIPGSNEQSVKDLSRWDNRYYLNIWVVSEINGNGADASNVNSFFGGTIGYAYLPTNPVTFNSDLDGIVMLNLSVGNDPNGSQGFRLWGAGETNRALTHEVGHFLGLNHVFNDNNPNACSNGDGIGDTPDARQLGQAFNCNYSNTCTNQMITNYMDYTSEDCQNRFTEGQKSVMRGILSGVRNDLVTTNNCAATSSDDYDAGISEVSYPSGTICESTFDPVVTLNNYGAATLTSVQIQYYVDTSTPSTFNWTGSLSTGQSESVTLPSVTVAAGAHTFYSNTSQPNSQSDEDNSNDASSSAFTAGSSDTYVTLLIYPDNYGSETTWSLSLDGGATVATGGAYTNNNNELIQVEICVQAGECYTFEILDSEGDGICCGFGTGTYSIGDEDGILINSGGEFTTSETTNFCVPTLAAGCAIEYNPFDANASGVTIYAVTAGGYVSGTNDYGDLSKVQAFAFPGQGYEVSGVVAWIATKTDNGNSVEAKMYALDGPGTNLAGAVNNAPGTVLATSNKPIAQIDTIGFFTRFDFQNPVQVSSGYAIGLDFSGIGANGDQLSIVSNIEGDANGTELAWEQWSTGDWYTMASAWTGAGDVDLALFPILCQSTTVGINEQSKASLQLFPNPNNGNFVVTNPNMVEGVLKVYNSFGQVLFAEPTNGQSAINMNMLDKQPGVYFVKLDSDQLNWVKRIVVQ